MESDFDFSKLVVTGVRSAGRIYAVPMSSQVRRTNRPCWGLALKQSGRTVYVAENGRFYSDALHPILLPMGADYSWACLEAGPCLMIEFECPTASRELYSFHVPSNSVLVRNFLHIEKRQMEKTGASHIKNMYDLYGSLLFLADSREEDYVPSRTRSLVQPAVDYMLSRYDDPTISNDSLAAMCGVSTVYFRKLFHKLYHAAPMQYLHNVRMERAGALLQSDYYSIRQVAESVGYRSLYNFSKMFKRRYGTPPSRFHAEP